MLAGILHAYSYQVMRAVQHVVIALHCTLTNVMPFSELCSEPTPRILCVHDVIWQAIVK
jgi:hypothetical protein